MRRGTHWSDAQVLIRTLALGATARGAHEDRLREAWRPVDHRRVLHLVEREGAVLWLSRRLRERGISLEEPARTMLADRAKAAVAQGLRIDAELAHVRARLAGVGIACVALKGAAMREIAGRVPYASARAPGDVDILCRQEDAEGAWHALASSGYASPRKAPDDAHHLPALVGPRGVGVDIHVTMVAGVSPAEAWRRGTSGGSGPDDTELFWHAVSHSLATVAEEAYASLRLRHWLDASALIAAKAPLDWDVIRGRIESPECTHPSLARAWIRVACELAAQPLPMAVAGDSARLELDRLLGWRLRLADAPRTRWTHKLLEEGTRGEAGLSQEPSGAHRNAIIRARHRVASGAARVYWRAAVRSSA